MVEVMAAVEKEAEGTEEVRVAVERGEGAKVEERAVAAKVVATVEGAREAGKTAVEEVVVEKVEAMVVEAREEARAAEVMAVGAERAAKEEGMVENAVAKEG